MKRNSILSTALALALACSGVAFAQTMAPTGTTMSAPAKPATVAAPKAAKAVHFKHKVLKKKISKKTVTAAVKPAA